VNRYSNNLGLVDNWNPELVGNWNLGLVDRRSRAERKRGPSWRRRRGLG